LASSTLLRGRKEEKNGNGRYLSSMLRWEGGGKAVAFFSNAYLAKSPTLVQWGEEEKRKVERKASEAVEGKREKQSSYCSFCID